MKTRTQAKIRAWLGYGLGGLSAFLLVLPLIWVISTSLRPLSEVTSTPPMLFPRSITFKAYVDLWSAAPFDAYILNSVVISLATALIALAFSISAAYAFARFRFPGSTALLMLVVMSQMLPGSSILIPLFQVIRNLGLLDTRTGMVLIYTGFAIPFCTWLLNGYFRAIPEELEQAALIDGCSRLQFLWRILLPLAAPAVVAVGTFAFLLSWNEFLFAFVFTKSKALTIPVGLRSAFLGQYVNKYDQLFAASLIFSLPPIALFVSLQRFFVQGLTAGAVKE
ncbi:MAG: carbohydrate ABC transporter permease [Candidatus Latescibacteria bacterium]|jgi:ABC-type glycerol-3-phosphate transport system permease component|nr:carbohydrate ABC transporter permease [Candidatus Latescibacterota bacterium]